MTTTPTRAAEPIDSRHVADLVAQDPRRAAVFERLGIDYCCGGAIPLEQACRDHGLELATVRGLLAAATQADADERDWTEATIPELVEDIVERHHASLRRELPRVTMLAHKVAKAHGAKEPRLVEAEGVVTQLVDELVAHTTLEEEEVFPACLASAATELDADEATQLAEALGRLVDDHTEAAGHLEQLSALLDGYDPPLHACTSWRAYLDALARLEHDTHRHVHKENHVLFPKVMDRLYAAGAPRS